MRRFFIIMFLVGLGGNLASQVLDSVWTKVYDFRQNPDDRYGLNSGVFTSDSTFVLIGFVEENGFEEQVFVWKVNRAGDTLWTKTFGSALTYDIGSDIIETSDGNLMALSIVQFDGNLGRVRLDKLTPEGNVIWEKTYLAETDYAWGYALTETSDSGIIVTGVCESDVFVLKTDANGDSLWVSYFGGSAYDVGDGVAPTVDGGAIVVGCLSTAEVTYDSLWVIRVDSSGNEVWSEAFPFNGGTYYYGKVCICRNTEGNYLVAAAPDVGPVFVYKLDEDGTVLWSTELNQFDYVATFDIGEGVDGSTYITGSHGTDAQTIIGKVDSNGDSLFLDDLVLLENSTGYFVYQLDSGYVYVGGRLLDSNTVYFAKLQESYSTALSEENNIFPAAYTLFQNYPNPFNPTTTITFTLPKRVFVKLEIFDILGRKVKTLVSRELRKGKYVFDWDGTNSAGESITSGVYLYRLSAGDFSCTKKMVLLK